MKLIYFSKANLQDQKFVRDFVNSYSIEDKCIVVPEAYGPALRDIRFVTRRIAILLNEALIHSNAFTGDQRKLITAEGDAYRVDTRRLDELITHLRVLVIGPLIWQDGEAVIAEPSKILQALRDQMDIEELILFPSRALSPMVQESFVLESEEETNRLLGLYEEEAEVLQLGLQLRPVRYASTSNYSP